MMMMMMMMLFVIMMVMWNGDSSYCRRHWWRIHPPSLRLRNGRRSSIRTPDMDADDETCCYQYWSFSVSVPIQYHHHHHSHHQYWTDAAAAAAAADDDDDDCASDHIHPPDSCFYGVVQYGVLFTKSFTLQHQVLHTYNSTHFIRQLEYILDSNLIRTELNAWVGSCNNMSFFYVGR